MAVPAGGLPPPKSGQFLEISFRRLLKSCCEIMAGDTKGRADLSEWRTSPVFHHVWAGHLYHAWTMNSEWRR